MSIARCNLAQTHHLPFRAPLIGQDNGHFAGSNKQGRGHFAPGPESSVWTNRQTQTSDVRLVAAEVIEDSRKIMCVFLPDSVQRLSVEPERAQDRGSDLPCLHEVVDCDLLQRCC